MYSDACTVRDRAGTNFLIKQGTPLPHLTHPPALVHNAFRLGGLKTLGDPSSAMRQGIRRPGPSSPEKIKVLVPPPFS